MTAMLKTEKYRRQVQYFRRILDMTKARGIPSLLVYGPERVIRLDTRPSLYLTFDPVSSTDMRLTITVPGIGEIEDEFNDVLLEQKLHKYLNTMEKS